MRTDRHARFALIAGFLAMITVPGPFQFISELRDGDTPRVLDIFRQPPTARNLHAYEHSLEDSSVVINQLRPPMQYFQWKLLDDAGEKVVVGRHGWLFYRPSVRYLTERQASTGDGNAEDPLPAIRSFRDQLATRGIRLLIVVVPNKESVYPEMLARQADATVLVCERTRRLLDQLEHHGIEHVNLFDVFRRARQAESALGSRWLYLAQDSHWSPDGAQLAAAAVARRALEGDIASRGNLAYVERSVTVKRHGDLVQMLQVPQIERALEPELLNCSRVIQSDTETPYADVPHSRILILGDSFLRIYEQDEPGSAGFIAHLARELRQGLTSLINDGGASTIVRRELSRRSTLLMNKSLVIWEFAEREIRFGTGGWQIVPLVR